MPTLVETPASPSSIDVDDDAFSPPPPPQRRHQLDLQATGEVAGPTARRRRDVWVVAATTVGNALELYDFALFGFLAPELATKFFPPKKHLNSALLETFLVFGAAFLVRPLGGLAMGAFSDRHGRKRALQLSVVAMSGATASIGLLPTYAMVGSLATCLLVLCRIIQGLSVAGQLTGALIYLVESAPPGHEHLFGSLAFASGNAGTMLGGVAVAFVQTRAGQDAFGGHGWRYPFLLSAFLGWGGYYIQSYAEESPEYLAVVEPAEADEAKPRRSQLGLQHNGEVPGRDEAVATVDAVKRSGPKVAALAAACVLSPAAFYAFFVFAPAFYPLPQATLLATRCLLLSVLVMPLAGATIDARRATHGDGVAADAAVSAAVALGVASPVIFAGLASQNAHAAALGLALAAVFHSTFNAALAGWLVRAFDPRARGAVLGFAWNVAAALVGGTAPAFAVLLIEVTGSDVAPGFYISVLAALAVGGIRALKPPAAAEDEAFPARARYMDAAAGDDSVDV